MILSLTGIIGINVFVFHLWNVLIKNVKNFTLNADEKIEYQLSAPKLVVSHDYEGSVWEDFDNEMTYDMMMNLD